MYLEPSEAAIQSYFYEKLFWKYAANLEEKIHVEVWNHTLTRVFSCKFASYFQNTFP